MKDATAALARSITRASSKQTYYTARLMVDKDLVDDFCRAYAYFRWADDVVDAPALEHGVCLSEDERASFVRRQKVLLDRLYRHERPDDLTPEEEIVATLIGNDRADGQYPADAVHPAENSGLRSFIRNMFAIIEFDAYRKGRLVNEHELAWYSNCLGKAVVDGLQYFVGNGHPYPFTTGRYLAAIAAHIVHMLRDMVQDVTEGYINIPREYLEAHGIGPEDVNSPPFRAWVQEQVEQARQYFCEGKRYLDELDVLRCKIVGYWYCARFEGILDAIEHDGYTLRADYKERRKVSAWLQVAWLTVSVTLRHIARRVL